MVPAEVVGTAHQIHPPGQDPFATDDRTAAALLRQSGESEGPTTRAAAAQVLIALGKDEWLEQELVATTVP